MGPIYFEIFNLEIEKKLQKCKVELSGEKSEKSMKIHGSGTPKSTISMIWCPLKSMKIDGFALLCGSGQQCTPVRNISSNHGKIECTVIAFVMKDSFLKESVP